MDRRSPAAVLLRFAIRKGKQQDPSLDTSSLSSSFQATGEVLTQGKHRYYSLEGPDVAGVLEGLSVLAGGACDRFVPRTPSRLRAARTCYDHMAGTVGVSLHDRFQDLGWLSAAYDLTPDGTRAFEGLGIDLEATRTLRRRFACACLDWSERRPHVGGALGAAVLKAALKRKWVTQDLDSRALDITKHGRSQMSAMLGLRLESCSEPTSNLVNCSG